MWHKIGDTEVIRRITRKIAEDHSVLPELPRGRALREERIDALVEDLKKGEVVTFRWATVDVGGVVYRIQGKHSSKALMDYGDKIPPCDATMERYKADDMASAVRLWGKYDTKVSAHTSNEMYLHTAASLSSIAGLPARMISLAAKGLSMDLWERAAPKHTDQDRAQLLLAHPNFVLFIHDVFDGGNKRHALMMRGPVTGAMARTFRKAQTESRTFWLMVRDATGSRPSCPSRRIREYLLSTSVLSGAGASTGRRAVVPEEMFCKCVTAWNAWRSAGTTDLKFYADKPWPKAT